jgi:hypothetical protein
MPDLAVAAPAPSLYVSGPTQRFVDRRGREWNVFDCMEISGRIMPVRVGSPAAEYRLFVATNTEQRLYRFDFDEGRTPQPVAVDRQLRESRPYTRE